MLAKLWKKVLLAVCIVACLFNIMSKLVNRGSLKENLENANDGVTVFDIFKKDDVQVEEGSDVIDGVIYNEENSEATSNENTDNAITENNSSEQEIVNEENASTEEQQAQENASVDEEKQDDTKKENKKTYTYSDFTIIF